MLPIATTVDLSISVASHHSPGHDITHLAIKSPASAYPPRPFPPRNISIPGFSGGEVRPYRRPAASDVDRARRAAVRQATLCSEGEAAAAAAAAPGTAGAAGVAAGAPAVAAAAAAGRAKVAAGPSMIKRKRGPADGGKGQEEEEEADAHNA